MPQPLVPVVNSASVTIAKADAPAFLTGIVALTPIPAGKTNDQITNYSFTVNPTTGAIAIKVSFKN